ncbi:MAG: DUF4870 domain-containing protein [Propionibacterium sp.]|nr:DUF4870 domain-containing protein [Propionibacterium sp.]
MTNDPYKDFDDVYGADEQPSTPPPPGPQPVTGPQNPFGTGPYADSGRPDPGPQSAYPPAYGSQPNPFIQRHTPVPYGYGQSPDRQRNSNMLRLNAWISAFFPLAGVIFFFVEKGKQPLYDKHLKETLNMSITRILIGMGASMFSGFLGAVFGIATVAYFVLAIMGAMQGPTKFLEGQEMRYKGAIPFTRD